MKARNLTYSGELLCRRNYFVGTSLKVLSYSYPSGAGGNPPLSPSMIRGSSFIALIVETTCSVLILDQSGSPQAQAQAGLICSITVSINTRTRTLSYLRHCPSYFGRLLIRRGMVPIRELAKTYESMWLCTESRCWTLEVVACL